ncbi:hypothetical protein [Actinosynnema sp. NPDC020468]|uniref:allene oxide cyclase barrel-like domain-containing protein n=1 Tax=Actinosynnema sp. NPDC020468 TaxID=3154488 RepID=UPI0033E86BB3
MRARSRWSLVGAGCLTAMLTVGASAVPAQAPDAQRKCTVFDRVDDKVISLVYNDVGPKGPSPGDTGSYSDVLYDSTGRLLGTVSGEAWDLAPRPHDQHLLSYYREVVSIDGGTVQVSGVTDKTAMLQGATTTLTAVGVSGRWLGTFGTRQWLVESSSAAKVKITLCAP